MLSFTVAICAFNSTDKIGRALDALSNLRYSGQWGVLIVDNASTDGTGEFVLQWADRLPALRVVREPLAGLAHARMRAIRECTADALCFVDDDNLLAADYLAVANELLEAHRDVGALAGRSELYEIASPPDWFAAVASCYAVGPQGRAEGYMGAAAAPWGAGSVFRSNALSTLLDREFVPVLTGRQGQQQLAGDDVELCYAINLLGWRSFYSPRLSLGHAIEPKRMNLENLRKTCVGFGRSSIAIEAYRGFMQGGWRRAFKHSDWASGGLVALFLLRAGLTALTSGTLRARATWWLALGAASGYFVEGRRPSTVLKSPFVRGVLSGKAG